MRAIYSPPALIISAFLTGLAHQPLQLGWLAWFALLPLIFVLNRITELRHFIITGFIWGFTYHLTVIFWLANNIGTTPLIGFISMLSAVSFLTLNIVAVSILTGILKKGYPKMWFWFFPLVWTSMEYLRSNGTVGFPWMSLANTQLDFLTLAQNAEITGIYGISFWVVFINILLFNWLVRPYPENSFGAISIFILPWLTGLWLTPHVQTDSASTLEVAVVQPNIHQSQKWKPGGVRENIASLLYDSRPAIEQNVDLVVWPESSTSTYILQGNDFYLKWIQGELQNSKLISGIPYYSGKNTERKYYNSAVLIQADSVKDIYHKLQLVPMAEYIPLSDYFTSLKKLNLGQSNFTHGTNYTIMDVNKIKCAVMICFESIFPSLSRQFVQQGAEVLLFLVNDGWYENPPQPQQHAKQAVYRAIENRRPVIRCTNTGISMVIDAGGNISHALPLNEKGMIQTTIKPQNISTFYTRHGDIFAKLNVISSLLIIVGGMIRKK